MKKSNWCQAIPIPTPSPLLELSRHSLPTVNHVTFDFTIKCNKSNLNLYISFFKILLTLPKNNNKFGKQNCNVHANIECFLISFTCFSTKELHDLGYLTQHLPGYHVEDGKNVFALCS